MAEKRKTKSEAEVEVEPSDNQSGETDSPEGQELNGPAHEQGYTEDTARRNREDFGKPVPEVGLEGRGVPGVS